MGSLQVKEFLAKSAQLPIVDVRTPSEFAVGHVPNAINIPLFSDAERAQVGTIYKTIGKSEAILLGLELVGPKLASFVQQVTPIAINNQVLVHCWRGGMRSTSMAWLFNLAGIESFTLEGGYKAYRRHIRSCFEQPYNIVVLSGYTGSGKTGILHRLSELGEQVVDLEAIAHHKGSAFGALGQAPQPSNEQFENNLYEYWKRIAPSKRVWLEDESRSIGHVFLPDFIFDKIRTAPVVFIDVDKKVRIERLVSEYAVFEHAALIEAITRISKRMGGVNTKLCMEALERNDYHTVANITLSYYDKTYLYGLTKREDSSIYRLKLESENEYENAEAIVNYVNGVLV